MPTVNLIYNNDFGTENEDFEAEVLLYNEINYYRHRKGSPYCHITQRMVQYASRWNVYMMERHINENNNFYKHSTYGPDSLHIPNNTGEVIHVLYFDHKPSSFEAAFGLLYGLNRGKNSIIGWTQSPSHDETILESKLIYYGVSVYIAKKDKWWVCYGTVNLSYAK